MRVEICCADTVCDEPCAPKAPQKRRRLTKLAVHILRLIGILSDGAAEIVAATTTVSNNTKSNSSSSTNNSSLVSQVAVY